MLSLCKNQKIILSAKQEKEFSSHLYRGRMAKVFVPYRRAKPEEFFEVNTGLGLYFAELSASAHVLMKYVAL